MFFYFLCWLIAGCGFSAACGSLDDGAAHQLEDAIASVVEDGEHAGATYQLSHCDGRAVEERELSCLAVAGQRDGQCGRGSGRDGIGEPNSEITYGRQRTSVKAEGNIYSRCANGGVGGLQVRYAALVRRNIKITSPSSPPSVRNRSYRRSRQTRRWGRCHH